MDIENQQRVMIMFSYWLESSSLWESRLTVRAVTLDMISRSIAKSIKHVAYVSKMIRALRTLTTPFSLHKSHREWIWIQTLRFLTHQMGTKWPRGVDPQIRGEPQRSAIAAFHLGSSKTWADLSHHKETTRKFCGVPRRIFSESSCECMNPNKH